MKHFIILFLPLYLLAAEISVQVLGSGGPESTTRASASYLLKKDGKALFLVDFGGGAFLRFAQARAKIKDLEAVLLTHLHIDHVVDLPALMKAGYFSKRTHSLLLTGPQGNKYFPGFKEYMQLQFGTEGSYRYMSDILGSHSDSFSLEIYEMDHDESFMIKDFKITAVKVNHGIVPSLAYKIELEGKSIVFSGDTSAQTDALLHLSKDADILVAHHAIPQHGFEMAEKLHMLPSRIADIAAHAKVKKLLLSHRMKRTLGLENETEKIIRKKYIGPLIWAEDLMEIIVEKY